LILATAPRGWGSKPTHERQQVGFLPLRQKKLTITAFGLVEEVVETGKPE
jgi:hypothetical protein